MASLFWYALAALGEIGGCFAFWGVAAIAPSIAGSLQRRMGFMASHRLSWAIFISVAWLLPGAVLRSSDAPAPSIDAIVNAADHSGGRVAPGEIVVLFVSNAGPALLAGAQIDRDGKTSTLLSETRVWFDGIAAPMVYTVAGSVSVVVPYAVADRESTRVVMEYQGVRSEAIEVPVVSSAPALFTLDSSGRGQAGMLNERGCCNSARNPAARGTIAALFATGAGQTRPAGIDGSVPPTGRMSDYPVPALPVRVTVGGRPAGIVYAGAAPHAVAGLLQVNFRVPLDAPTGDAIPLVLKVGDSSSSDGVTMAVRSREQQILVAGDVPAVRNWLARVLAGAGYEVSVARNGREAMARASEHGIDLVICSLTMPEAERTELVRTLLATMPQLKVVATADVLGPRTLRAADLIGAQAVLTKPLSSKAVVRRVGELLSPRAVPYVSEEGAAVAGAVR
jgi:uncharacterized protein (TIGR03437 family)